jgi:hypothetical protein
LDIRIFSIADDRHWARPQTVTSKWRDNTRKDKKIMTKYFILTIFTSVLFFACQTSDIKTNGQPPTNTDSIQKVISDKLRQDSADCKGLMKRSLENKGLFKAICINDTVKGTLVNARKGIPFDTLITKTKDTLFYSFRVSSECCVKYYGMFFDPGDDTIILAYGYCGDVCDCYCDYLLTYKIPIKKYKFKHIAIAFWDTKKIRDKSGHQS